MLNKSFPDPLGDRVTVDELSDTLGPGAETVNDKFTVPLKPFTLARDKGTVPEEDREIVIEVVLAMSEKSGARRTVTSTMVECDSEVEFPMMVTV